MSEGPKRTTTGRTMRNSQTLEVELPTPGKVRITIHGQRTHVGLDVPADAIVGDPKMRPIDVRNSDDLEER